MPEIYLCEIPEAYVKKQGNSYIAELRIPENFADHENPFDQDREFALAMIKELEERGKARIATPEQPLKPPSAGFLDVLVDSDRKIKYVVMFEKDDDSPRTPGHHTPFHGYPNKVGEWSSLNHAYREASTEILYVVKNTVILTRGTGYSDSIILNELNNVRDKSAKVGYELGISKNMHEYISPSTLTNDEMDILKIFNHGMDNLSEHRGSFAWYPFVDMIMVRGIELPIEGLMIYDLEGFWRDAVLVKPEELKGKASGEIIPAIVMENPKDERGIPVPGKRTKTEKEIIFKPIPVLMAALHDLDIYPKDWMNEL